MKKNVDENSNRMKASYWNEADCKNRVVIIIFQLLEHKINKLDYYFCEENLYINGVNKNRKKIQ